MFSPVAGASPLAKPKFERQTCSKLLKPACSMTCFTQCCSQPSIRRIFDADRVFVMYSSTLPPMAAVQNMRAVFSRDNRRAARSVNSPTSDAPEHAKSSVGSPEHEQEQAGFSSIVDNLLFDLCGDRAVKQSCDSCHDNDQQNENESLFESHDAVQDEHTGERERGACKQ
jgi:hypothetical protein